MNKIFQKILVIKLFLLILVLNVNSASLNTVLYDPTTLQTSPLGLNGNFVAISNRVLNAPGASSTVTIYGTNQFWRLNVTSNLTLADSALRSNVVYWVKLTNNTSTITFPGSWRWLDGPSFSTSPSLTGGEYILRIQKFDDATNSWIETGPGYNLSVAGPLISLVTNNGTIYISNSLNLASQTVSGSGNGSTNYIIPLSTNSINDFYLGSSNVNILAANATTTTGYPIYWNAFITNLSANTWGISFSSSTNRWRFSGNGSTNAPTVLSNNSCLMLSGRSDGTNTVVGYTYYVPGL